jgi:hypothetical protein
MNLIKNQPNKRYKPLENDLSGYFSYWFDGGAAIVMTGLMNYEFADGTKARQSVLAPGENYITFEFADGSSVTLYEKDWLNFQ